MNIFLFLTSGVLFRVGGEDKALEPFIGMDKKWVRVMLLPFLLCLRFALPHPLLSLLSFGSLQALRVGYGVNSLLMKWLKESWLARAAAGFLYGLAGGFFFLGCTHHYQEYAAYIVINTFINGVLTYLKANDITCEVGAGLGVGSLLWMIH